MIPNKTNISEFPRHPQAPPTQEQQPRVQPPTVFVYEKQRWKYKVISKDAAADVLVTEGELNGLGQEGWGFVGVVPTSGGAVLPQTGDCVNATSALYLVRPDGYVALASPEQSQVTLAAYLNAHAVRMPI